MNNLTHRAREFATERHGGQLRKYDGTPYTMHLCRVAEIVSSVPYSSDNLLSVAISSAWLHDTLEDTNTTLQEIFNEFGWAVANIVDLITDRLMPDNGNREFRKTQYMQQLREADCPTFTKILHTIKLADLIDNCDSIVKYDPKFAKVYLREMYQYVGGDYLIRGDKKLRMKVWSLLDAHSPMWR